MKKCPGCGYERKPADIAPNYECPRCGIVYSKFTKRAPVEPADGQQRKQSEKSYFNKKLTKAEIIIAFIGVIIVIISMSSNIGKKLWAHIIGPFDSRPSVSFNDLAQGDAGIRKKAKELCEWAKREELRDPSVFNVAQRKSACRSR